MSLTSTAQVMGSPNYMSPEQLRSARDVDHRTDIWALGAILYELLTGRVPFVAQTVTQLTAMVVADPPRPMTELRPDLPPALVAVVMKCLEKRAEDRFSSVAELCDALSPFTSTDGAAKVRDIVRNSGESGKSIPVPAPERSSIRVMGPAGTTENSAWDRTQLANGVAPPRGRWMLIVGAVATVATIGVIASIVLKKPSDGGAATPHTVDTNTLAVSALPTVRETVSPPLVVPTGGSEQPAASVPSTVPIIKRPDAGAGAGAMTKKPDASSNGGDLLPNVRN